MDGPGLAGGTQPRYAIIEFDHTNARSRILSDTEASTYGVGPGSRREVEQEAQALADQARSARVRWRSYWVTYMETVATYPVD
jgi:hypothetical protein